MKINAIITPIGVDELYFTGKSTVVIDVLRATSTIVQALANGAKEIIPVASVEFAVKVSGGMFGGQTLLGGERNTRKIEGFALGNSPLEYTQEIVAGKSIILYTTNGSKALVKAKFSEHLFACAFTNITAIARHLAELGNDVEILCSGRNNSFSLEDVVCAGRLIAEISRINEDLNLTDSSKAALALNKSFGKNLQKMLADTEHGRLLLENGFEDDIKFCCKVNSSDAVPFYSGGVLKLMPAKTAPDAPKNNDQ